MAGAPDAPSSSIPARDTVSPILRVGLWIESRPGLDSLSASKWAQQVVDRFDSLISPPPASQHAKLDRVVFVPSGALPLSGGNPRHHPDLRVRDLDLMWGVVAQDSLSPRTSREMIRTWLNNRGCLDERGFAVAWDMFSLPQRAANRLPGPEFPLDSRNMVYSPSWTTTSETTLSLECLRALASHKAGVGPTYSDQVRLSRELPASLSRFLKVWAQDALGHPASNAVLEIWRGRPDSRRPYAVRLEGAPDTLIANDSGEFAISSPMQWLADGEPWVHGKDGSRGVSYWRLSHAHRHLAGWMDASNLLSLPDTLDTLRLCWSLPSGSSHSWKEASEHWPRPWLAAESDSSGTLTIGLSVPSSTEYVLRVVDDHGHEILKSRPMPFSPGVYEKRLEKVIRPGSWDVRMDSPSSRLQVRLNASGITN